MKFIIENVNAWFGSVQSLKEISMEVKADEILTIIGPSNSGKTTFLRILNRMHELNPVFRMQGRVQFNGSDISTMEVGLLRKKIGMVFALPLPLPFTIYENITYALKMHGIRNRSIHMERAEKALRQASLWNEVKDRLKTSAFKLSGGQQQRLCIARTLALEPDVILFDEPCSGLDPISTAKVEEAMFELKKEYTIVLVTNNVKQAARVGDKTAFFLNGELIELDKTEKIFTVPSDQRTDDYIRGKFG